MAEYVRDTIFILKVFELSILVMIWLVGAAIIQSGVFCCWYWGLVMLLAGLWTPTYLTGIMIWYHSNKDYIPSLIFNALLTMLSGVSLIVGSLGYFVYPHGIVVKEITYGLETIHCGIGSFLFAASTVALAMWFFADAMYTLYYYLTLEEEEDRNEK
ncbi:uncharacterized protein [Atheta coriaria]|uniref:uncharacterized protein n=1 Tax=Dalotia coriaria TaxID=877792 RepID=UPI0031F3441A